MKFIRSSSQMKRLQVTKLLLHVHSRSSRTVVNLKRLCCLHNSIIYFELVFEFNTHRRKFIWFCISCRWGGYTCVATVCTLKLKKHNLSNPGYIIKLMSTQNAFYKALRFILIDYIYMYIWIYTYIIVWFSYLWSFDGSQLWFILD